MIFVYRNTQQQVREHGLTVNEEKCLLNLPKIIFFRIVLSKDGISADETKFQAVKKRQKLGYIAQFRTFLGLVTYLGSFKPNFADLIDPLHKLLRKGKNWEWGDQQN